MHPKCLNNITNARMYLDDKIIGDVSDIEYEIKTEHFSSDSKLFDCIYPVEFSLTIPVKNINYIIYPEKYKRKSWFLFNSGKTNRIRKKNFKRYYNIKNYKDVK